VPVRCVTDGIEVFGCDDVCWPDAATHMVGSGRLAVDWAMETRGTSGFISGVGWHARCCDFLPPLKPMLTMKTFGGTVRKLAQGACGGRGVVVGSIYPLGAILKAVGRCAGLARKPVALARQT
jgi:hypothetical protein